MPYRSHSHDKHDKTEKTFGHVSSVIAGFKQISHVPIASFFLILVIAFSLFLAVAFYILWENVNTLNDKWNESAEISLYLKKNINLKTATELVEKLQSNSAIAKVALIRPDEGMKSFIESTAFNKLLSSFKENPLPHVIVVHPKIKVLPKDVIPGFIKELQSYHEVEVIKADADWIERAHNLINLWDRFSLFLIFMLGINALLVMCGASYIMAQNFIARSEVSKIVVQYQFAWYGLISGLFVLLAARLILMMLQDQNIFLQGFEVGSEILVVLVSLLLSFFSSRVAASNG